MPCFNWGPFPHFVYLGRHCHHSHDKMDQVFPYCKQLKTGQWTVDGGKAREGGYFIWHVSKQTAHDCTLMSVYIVFSALQRLRWPCKIGTREPKPQNQLLLFANYEPKSCAHEFNYVVRLPIRPVKEAYHIIIFTFCKVNANRCNILVYTWHGFTYTLTWYVNSDLGGLRKYNISVMKIV